MSSTSALHIGVSIPDEVQLLDLASVDLFSILDQDYIRKCGMPEEVISQSISEVKFYYIGDTSTGAHQGTIAEAFIQLTHTLNDEEFRPGGLDIILIPGPYPTATTSEKIKAWAQVHAAQNTVFLIVCSGSYIAGNSGLIDGKLATGPRFSKRIFASRIPK